MFGFFTRMVRRSYASADPFTSDLAAFFQEGNAIVDMFTPPELRAEMDRDRREQKVRQDAARDMLREGHARLVRELLADLSKIEGMRAKGSFAPSCYDESVASAHEEHDRRMYQMEQTVERIYGHTAVFYAKSDLGL